MRNWIKKFIDIILPPRCLICGGVVCSGDSLCKECFNKVNFITKPFCNRCGKPLAVSLNDDIICAECLKHKSPLNITRAIVKYDDFSKKIILDFKFRDHLESKLLLARWLFVAGKDIFDNNIDMIIPVPLHYARLFKRKYNQSAILVAELSKLSGIKADYKSLKKIKHTTPQVQCKGKQRSKNVRGAFMVVSPDEIKGKHILLVDDVYTTGSTLCECARTLKKSGAKSVYALTVAMVCK